MNTAAAAGITMSFRKPARKRGGGVEGTHGLGRREGGIQKPEYLRPWGKV